LTGLFPNLKSRLRSLGARLSGASSRLAGGRALVSNPELLLMDEPTEGLAPADRARARPHY
jgi:branched-chain amino acid transport system ATP-binding protein